MACIFERYHLNYRDSIRKQGSILTFCSIFSYQSTLNIIFHDYSIISISLNKKYNKKIYPNFYTTATKEREVLFYPCVCLSVYLFFRNTFLSHSSKQLLIADTWNFNTIFFLVCHLVGFVSEPITRQLPVKVKI